METVKIKCPHCGVVLTIKYIPNLEQKSIPCPVCKKNSPYTSYRKIEPQSANPKDNGETLVNGDKTQLNDDETEVGKGVSKKKSGIGLLRLPGLGISYNLHPGVNIIGRKAQTSNATVQIETSDRTMSRMHICIEVCQLKSGDYVHYLSNKDNKNDTYVSGQLVYKGDRIVLNGDESIKMGNTIVRFINAKTIEEETIYGDYAGL